MTTETRITAGIVEDDPERVSVYFRWNPRVWAHGVQASIHDGEVHLWLHLEDARELHSKLGEALKSPEANGIDPDYEQGRADWESEQRVRAEA